jgi:hypothetical protein
MDARPQVDFNLGNKIFDLKHLLHMRIPRAINLLGILMFLTNFMRRT